MDENCRKTKTRAIIPANHDRIKQLDEPIRILAITGNLLTDATWRDVTRRMCQSREARLPPMSNIHKRIRFSNSDGPLVQMVRLLLIENEIIPMVVLVQNKFAFRPSNNALCYSSFYKPTTNGVYLWVLDSPRHCRVLLFVTSLTLAGRGCLVCDVFLTKTSALQRVVHFFERTRGDGRCRTLHVSHISTTSTRWVRYILCMTKTLANFSLSNASRLSTLPHAFCFLYPKEKLANIIW